MTQIQLLIELQDIDSQLMELEALLGDLPKKVAELTAREERLIATLNTDKTRLKELELALKKAEATRQDLKTKIDRLKDQSFLASNNKQYDALMHEIDFLKTELDTVETEVLEWMEEKSQLETQVSEQESSLETLTSDLQSRRQVLEQQVAESSDEKARLEAQREEKVSRIEARYLRQYDRVRTARRGVAVIAIRSNACGGCGAFIPPQKIADVKSGASLASCDSCNRFLYWSDSDA